ncbi:MAG: VCBS repeat-containing protein [Candidatus Hydrogenedentes bacterium]|nr:VCBS repeat-containing protein [Candidatus Hydrogenedentota bacterium]
MAALLGSGCDPTDPGTENPNPNASARLFAVPLHYPAGERPLAVDAADLNNDGRTDLVTVNETAETVSVLLANDSGAYALHQDYPVGGTPRALLAEDFTGDSLVDVITANPGSSDLSLLVNTGSGVFAAEMRLLLAANAAPEALLSVDLNNDALRDLVTADTGIGSVSLLLKRAGGGWDPPVRHLVGDQPRALAAADINNDTHIDLVTANRGTGNLSILFGAGDGTFSSTATLDCGDSPRSVAIADFDADGQPDIAATAPGSLEVYLYYGLGAGLFDAPLVVPLDRPPTRMVAANVAGSAAPEIITVLFESLENPAPFGQIAILHFDGMGALEQTGIRGFDSGTVDILATDINNDSRMDLLSTSISKNTVVVVPGETAGLATELRIPVGRRPREVHTADLNRDGEPDGIVVNFDGNDLSLLFSTADGFWAMERRLAVGDIPRSAAVGLVNSDAFLDIVVTRLNQSQAALFLGNGDGTFQTVRTIALRAPGNTERAEPRSIALGDMDKDGDIDIVTGNANTNTVAIVLNNGAATFAPAVEYFAGTFPLAVKLADLNQDTHLDVVVANGQNPATSVTTAPRVNTLFGVGDGTLDAASRVAYTTLDSPIDMAIADVNGDGDLDVFTAHNSGNNIAILAGRENGRLSAGAGIRVGQTSNALQLVDFDGDGRKDVLTTSDNNSVAVLLNAGGTTYGTVQIFPAGDSPIAAIAVDVTGDSVLDVLAPNRDSDDLSVVRGKPF